MPSLKTVSMIKDEPLDQAVEVTVYWPDGVSIHNLQQLAEKAWDSPGKSITTAKGVTVLVSAFRR